MMEKGRDGEWEKGGREGERDDGRGGGGGGCEGKEGGEMEGEEKEDGKKGQGREKVEGKYGGVGDCDLTPECVAGEMERGER